MLTFVRRPLTPEGATLVGGGEKDGDGRAGGRGLGDEGVVL